jgi:hypothetical protein
MCCRACYGYDACLAKGNVREDDCCTECRYFESCMEEPAGEDTRPLNHQPQRRR